MAGRKQHYLPQHLLRGFKASKAGKKIQVVVYKKGTPPYITSTEGVAAQRDFYSQPGDGVINTLDDIITAFESSTFNPFLDRARTMASNEQLDAESAASAVVHLTLRAAHLRGSFAHLARQLFIRLGESLNGPKPFQDFMGLSSTSTESLLSEEIDKTFDALPITDLPSKELIFLKKMVRARVREKFDSQILKAAPLICMQISLLKNTIPNIVTKAHNRALQESLIPPARIEALKGLHWKVLAVKPPDHFVLPDCAAIAATQSGQLQALSLNSDDKISWVAMPISAKQVLIGHTGEILPKLSDLNECFAKCSLEYFVSSTNHSSLYPLTALIGEALEATTHIVLEDSFATAQSLQEPTATRANAFTIRVIFVEIGLDADKTTAIDQSIQQIFSQQCGSREAARLESIVITNDVAREVAQLYDRALSPYETATIAHGTVELIPAMTLPTLRLILPEPVCGLLLSCDVRLKRIATLLIKHLLGNL